MTHVPGSTGPHENLWSLSRLTQGMPPPQKDIPAHADQHYPDAMPDPTMFDTNGKPILDTSHHTRFAVSEKEMSDHQKMAWKNYQLWRTTLKMERRDTVLEALTSSDYPHMRVSHHWLGTPFPVIEPHPWVGEVWLGLRWYEHVMSLGTAILYFQYMRSKPTLRYGAMSWWSQKYIMMCVFGCMEMNFGYRVIWRLQGQSPNEPECYKYGVLETPHRLQVKAERWRKFKNYKEEWCRRWDYYMWGMRPGERWTLFSACWAAPWPVRFNTKTDYPIRKNPFKLSPHGVREVRLEANLAHHFVKDADDYLTRTRPEVKYIWRGGIG